eukprot:CAMPEP_0174826886 /NCGR_PEP_ID=MMETSP1114-20130205/290_1 /TAXON_ID=312471 /ORGANISM="Neobodo designis, Strain CCAP 1951/1" /LENGTH=272 /DNA_ID=CAMNT_0016060457 /DNA_START=209 /DNA_END=1027 /DNA_ORIENTATION=+
MSAGDEDLDNLRGENAELKREMAKLSEEMDKIQHRRMNKRAKGRDAKEAEAKVQNIPAELRIAMKQNEDLRKERLKLTAELQHSDTGRRIAEVRNALAVVNRQIQSKQDELKALEMQRKARRSIVEMAHHTEDELRLFRDQHRQELNGFKDEAHELTEEQKMLDQQMIRMQVQIHRIQEKIKLGVNGPAFEEMQQKVAHQEKEIADLEARVAELSGSIDEDTKRENRELKNLRAEKVRLNARIEEMKQCLVERERELKLSYNLTKPSPRPTS